MKSPSKTKRKKSRLSRKAKSTAAKKGPLKNAKRKSKRAAPAKKKKTPPPAKKKATRLLPRRPGVAASLTVAAAPLADPPSMTCSDGWYVTGYYTPVETDYHGAPQQINVSGRGSDNFPGDFLSNVRMEGWGKTRYGWFIGYDANQYSSANAPQSARGHPLAIGSLAVDRNEISFGSSVRITSLPPPWNNQLFVADDVGSMINQKHVDVYCGMGANARAQTFQITANSVRLCQKS
jgi:3D (Asp-Asp-Asp) domain-containing protein